MFGRRLAHLRRAVDHRVGRVPLLATGRPRAALSYGDPPLVVWTLGLESLRLLHLVSFQLLLVHLLTRGKVEVVNDVGYVCDAVATAVILRRVDIVFLVVHVGELRLNLRCFRLLTAFNETSRNLL